MLALSRLGAYELLRAGSTTVVDYYLHPKALAKAIVEVGLRGGRPVGFDGDRIVTDAQAVADRQWRLHGSTPVSGPPYGSGHQRSSADRCPRIRLRKSR